MNSQYSQSEQYISQLGRIEKLISDGKLQEAVGQLNLLAKENANDPRLFLLGSRLAEASRNPQGMLAASRKAHQLAPQWPVATIHLAAVLAQLGEDAEAAQLSEQAVLLASNQSTLGVELLTKAAAIEMGLRRWTQALKWLRQAESMQPNDFEVLQQIAQALTSAGDHSAALPIYSDLLQKKPNNAALLLSRMQALTATGQADSAVQDGEALLVLEPENAIYRYYFEVAKGNKPESQPDALVANLFDSYAARFDRHLVTQLRYQLPDEVARLILGWYPDRKCHVLDLGCGTGLLGGCLERLDGMLVGVDLSGEMIKQATRRGVYSRFYVGNISDALQASPADQYHVVAALDVMVYVGKLDLVIPDVLRVLLPGGCFVCSFEEGADGDGDYALKETHRYTHHKNYVQRVMQQAGFQDIQLQDRVLRLNNGKPVNGFLVVARKIY